MGLRYRPLLFYFVNMKLNQIFLNCSIPYVPNLTDERSDAQGTRLKLGSVKRSHTILLDHNKLSNFNLRAYYIIILR